MHIGQFFFHLENNVIYTCRLNIRFCPIVRQPDSTYPQYEQQMQSMVLPTDLSPKQRFNTSWKLRKQTRRCRNHAWFWTRTQLRRLSFYLSRLSVKLEAQCRTTLKSVWAIAKPISRCCVARKQNGMYQQALDLVTQAPKQPCWNGTFKAKFATAYLTEKKRQNVQQQE